MLEQTQEIVEFARDKINALYDEYKGAAPGEYEKQVIDAMVETTKELLKAAVKIEALDKLGNMEFDYSQDAVEDFREILHS